MNPLGERKLGVYPAWKVTSRSTSLSGRAVPMAREPNSSSRATAAATAQLGKSVVVDGESQWHARNLSGFAAV